MLTTKRNFKGSVLTLHLGRISLTKLILPILIPYKEVVTIHVCEDIHVFYTTGTETEFFLLKLG